MYEYSSDGKVYEKYRDQSSLFEIKRHNVKQYYAHFHYAVEVCFVLSGSFEYSINGKKGKASEGEIVFVNPGELHEYFASENCRVYVVIMSEIYSADYCMEFGPVSFDNLLTNQAVNAKIKQCFDECFKNRQECSFLENKIFANKLYVLLHRNYSMKAQTKNELFLNKILEYIYSHYKENITEKTLAEQFSYSTEAISKLFQKEIKIDFRVFVNNVRADAANKMLNDTNYKDWPLSQIAMECGFVSFATFYRSYKRRFSCLPTKG